MTPRRHVLLGAFGLVTLAACGRPPAANAVGRTVTTAWGPTTVPDPVRSVVVLEGRRDADIALAAAGARELFTRNSIDLEAVAAATPDLILGRDEDVEEIRAELTRIGPVLPLGSTSSGVPWQDDLRLVAAATGTEDRAETAIAGDRLMTAGVDGQVQQRGRPAHREPRP